jgi:hypothetical protein
VAGDQIETKERFTDDPSGWALRWSVEFEGARKVLKHWQERGRKVVDRYLDERGESGGTRLNLFHGDIETKKSLIFGNTPRVRSRRRFADADDDEARISAEMQERLLNTDIERDEDGFQTALELARDDRLLPGLGAIRMRYVVEWEDVPEVPAQVGPDGVELAPSVPATKRKAHEDVETNYVPWDDFLYSPCRYWGELRWEAFAADMTREALHERFDATISDDADKGKLLVDRIPLNAKDKAKDDDKRDDPWARSRVWEIWCKEGREVFWYVEGFDIILDRKLDPLGLEGFWPNPKPMFANVTSKALVPVPDFCLAQDSYDAIDTLYAKIELLTAAVRVTGVYDENSPEIQRILTEAGVNRIYPAKNMAALMDKGGIEGSISWFPLEQIVKGIEILTAKLHEEIALKDQVTGIADVMRGNATPGGGKTATEQRIKARFGSTRIQAAQKEFAQFASDAQRIRAEIIAKWFDVETIVERSNMLRSADAQTPEGQALVMKAAQLLKDEHSQYRIEVAGEGLGMTDFDAEKQDGIEFLQAVTGSLKEVGEIGVNAPWAVPHLLKLVKHGLSRFPGSQEMEGSFDALVDEAEKQAAAPPAPPQPDPAAVSKLEAEKVKAGAAHVKAQAEVVKAQTGLQQTVLDAQAARESFGQRMAEVQANREAALDQAPLNEGGS